MIMIKFLWKGLLRDRNRSLFPVITTSIGVMLVVFLSAWLPGVMDDSIRHNANFNTGHVKVITQGYWELQHQMPLDLAMDNTDEIITELKSQFPDMNWTARVRFGGLLDVADENGETKAQGPASAIALDLLGQDSKEIGRFNILQGLSEGKIPENPDEILLAEKFAAQLGVKPGDTVTLFGSTMYGSMTFYNFTIAGLLSFGVSAMDRSTIITTLEGAQMALDMQGAATEILGFFPDMKFSREMALAAADAFNAGRGEGEFDLKMVTLMDQNGLGDLLSYMDGMLGFILFIFVFLMFIVLWNSGLIGAIRRYGEMGLRLAIGETKSHIYWTLILEAAFIGIMGSVIGTLIGLAFSGFLQVHGINIGDMMQNSSMLMSDTIRAKITPQSFYIGFLPGIFAPVLGSLVAGRGIYKRETASLFKELEI
jgi:putative ABC transport system permease protein